MTTRAPDPTPPQDPPATLGAVSPLPVRGTAPARERLAAGRSLRRYDPLDEVGQADYQEWRAGRGDA